MRNLEHYSEDTFEFHKSVLNAKHTSKNDPTYKKRVEDLEKIIKSQFSQYDTNFLLNTMDKIISYGFSKEEKEDLNELYSYRSKIMQDLKTFLTTTKENRKNSLCQNCTINSVNTFDHILPRSLFGEFIVNPKNLFPSCGECNGHKLANPSSSEFLNLYLDQLPSKQYLFVDIEIDGRDMETTFYCDNRNKICDALFNTISNHYDKMHLFQRFTDNNDLVISPLISSFKASIQRLGVKESIETVKETAERNRLFFGYNYWKSVLEIELVNNDLFLNEFLIK